MKNIRIKVYEVTEWARDIHEVMGLESHIGPTETMSVEVCERKAKVGGNEWHKANMPLEIEVDVPDGASVEGVVLDYINEKLCYGDILKASAVDFEECEPLISQVDLIAHFAEVLDWACADEYKDGIGESDFLSFDEDSGMLAESVADAVSRKGCSTFITAYKEFIKSYIAK